jgi:hypothetical protein
MARPKEQLPPKVGLMAEIIPEDEIDQFLEVHKSLKAKWENVAPDPADMDILNPDKAQMLDGYVKEALVQLAKGGVRNSLKKLAWVCYCQFDPEYVADWNDPEHRVQAAMVHRLGETDVFLTEYRDLKAHKDESSWTVQFQSDSGDVIQRERVFPFWGREHKLGLDTKQKAINFYRQQLKDRAIL